MRSHSSSSSSGYGSLPPVEGEAMAAFPPWDLINPTIQDYNFYAAVNSQGGPEAMSLWNMSTSGDEVPI